MAYHGLMTLLCIMLLLAVHTVHAAFVLHNDPHPPSPGHNASNCVDTHGHYDFSTCCSPHNDSWCCPTPHPHHEASIFALGDELDEAADQISMLFVIVAALSFFFEKITHFIEHKAAKHVHIAELVTAIYREVMLLGFISLVLFFVQQTALRDQFNQELFEFIHIFIFFAAVFFIIVVLVLLVLIRGTWKRWRKLQATSKAAILEDYARCKSQRDRAGCCWVLNPFLVVRYNHARQNRQFYLVRARFIDTQIAIRRQAGHIQGVLRPTMFGTDGHRQPGTDARVRSEDLVAAATAPLDTSETPGLRDSRREDDKQLEETISRFDFGKYLRRAVRHDVLEILEIDWRVWVGLVVIALANWGRVRAGGQFHTGDRGISVFIGVGWVCAVAFIIVYITTRHKLYRYYTKLKRETHAGENMYDHLTRASMVDSPSSTETKVSLLDSSTPGGSKPLKSLASEYSRTVSMDDVPGSHVKNDAQVDQKGYFWFKSPHFVLRVIQVLVLLECFYMALYVLVFLNRIIERYDGVLIVAVQLAALGPPALVIFAFLPLLLPVYSLMAHVESLTDRRHLKYILTYEERQKAREMRRAEGSDDDEDDEHGGHGHGGGGGGHGEHGAKPHFGQRKAHGHAEESSSLKQSLVHH